MATLTLEARASAVKITDKELVVFLVDGRELKVPLMWFARLYHAPRNKRKNFRLIGDGRGIHWPEIDEDISIPALLH